MAVQGSDPHDVRSPPSGLLDELARTLSRGTLEEGLSGAAQMLVSGLGDLCVVDVMDERGDLRRAAWAAADATRRTFAAELLERYPPDVTRSPAVVKMLQDAAAVVQPDTPEEHLVNVARDADHLALIRGLRLRSSVAVPVKGRRDVLGLLRVSSGQPERFSADDVAVLMEAGRAIGSAVETSRLAEAEARARAHARATEGRLKLLESCSAALAAGRELGRTLQDVAALAVPELADWATIDLVEDGVLIRGAVAYGDPALQGVAEAYAACATPKLDDLVGEAEVIRSGAPFLVPVIDDEMLTLYAQDAEQLTVLRAIAPGSTMLVPVRTDASAFGCFSLTRGRDRRPFDDDDLALAIDLGQRLGWAVENARLHQTAREMAAERDEMMSIVGHELKTPLTALRLGLDLLGRQFGNAPPSAHEQILRMKRQVVRVAELVDELVEDARVGSGRLELNRVRFDIAELVQDVVRRLEPLAAESGCGVQLRSEGTVVVAADRRRIEQVVTNLVGNACKYAPGAPIEVAVVVEDHAVRVVVEDGGPGMDAALLPFLFDRFRRGRHPGATGLGLGLWLARAIIEAHGGSIDAKNKADGGALFAVRLPR